MLGWNQYFVGVVDDQPISGSATVCDPGPAPLAHQSVKRHGDATSRTRPRDAAVLPPDVQIRFAVGDDEQRTRAVCFLFARARKAATKQHGPDELVNRN